MGELIKVGMADHKVGKAPASLVTYGLGSCIGIAFFDAATKIGGLAHIMLPDSKQARASDNPAKFADTALPLMLDDMLKLGAQMRGGERNADAVKAKLKQMDVRLLAEDTGGNYGRTVELNLENGIYYIKTIDKGQKEL